jgi:hypothetical protein
VSHYDCAMVHFVLFLWRARGISVDLLERRLWQIWFGRLLWRHGDLLSNVRIRFARSCSLVGNCRTLSRWLWCSKPLESWRLTTATFRFDGLSVWLKVFLVRHDVKTSTITIPKGGDDDSQVKFPSIFRTTGSPYDISFVGCVDRVLSSTMLMRLGSPLRSMESCSDFS